ncbi:DUF262 domain-containing protein [Luteolibacter soli]|uniref:DUF262 domain-containing protein n=1 Tax=Luteolibacter soli TaxID=3135280 RepID=A0ABU9AST4_9BACT
MIIKPTSLTVTQLLGSANEQYVVPAYQRRYSWKERQLADLWDDIDVIDGSDNHLLGSIVCLTGHHTAGLNRLEVVDGQQRLTTLSILLHCIHERLKADGATDEAQEIDRLLHAKPLGGKSVRKVCLDSMDSGEFELLAKGESAEQLCNSQLANAFATFRGWVAEIDLEHLRQLLYRLMNQAIVIRLDVSEAKDAFKLFETINNRGLRLSPTDIIKNFILGNSARFGKDELDMARRKWGQLISHLDGINSEAFFRHFLCAHLKKRITASYVIPNFKMVFMLEVEEAEKLPELHWYTDDEGSDEEEDDDGYAETNGETVVKEEDLDEIERVPFATFLDRLVNSAKTYREIALASTGKPKLDRRLRNLRMIKSLQTFGFLMAVRTSGCSDDNFEKILKLTEALLVRRHICRERANENETAFAKLCGVDPRNPLPEVIEAYRLLSPTDERFRAEFAETRFIPRLIERARYCLEQIELNRHGRHPELLVGGPDLVHVEHIIPQKIKTRRAKSEFGDWPAYLGAKYESQHPKFVSRIGNLTLFAGPLNIGASNNPYGRKKSAYKESAIHITKVLPTDYTNFRFAQVEARSEEFADLALEIWPIP